jgi:hypothetical protein
VHQAVIRRAVPALAALIALSSCGGSTQEPVVADPTDPPTTPAPTTAPPTTAGSTTTTPPTTQPAIASATGACIQGQWLMDELSTISLHQTLLPNFPVVVSGTQQITFDGPTVEYYINEVLRFQLPDTDLSTAFNTRSAGSWEIRSTPGVGDTIEMDYATVEGGFGPIEGTVIDNENNPLSVLVASPEFELPSIGSGPISCEGDTMTILVTSGLANELAVFTRIA